MGTDEINDRVWRVDSSFSRRASKSRGLSLIEPHGGNKKDNQYNNASVNRRVVSAKDIQRQAKSGRTYCTRKNRYRGIKATHLTQMIGAKKTDKRKIRNNAPQSAACAKACGEHPVTPGAL